MKYIYGVCLVVGFLVVLGTAGASDCGTIEFGQAVIRSIIGLLVSFVGLAGLKRLEEVEG